MLGSWRSSDDFYFSTGHHVMTAGSPRWGSGCCGVAVLGARASCFSAHLCCRQQMQVRRKLQEMALCWRDVCAS